MLMVNKFFLVGGIVLLTACANSKIANNELLNQQAIEQASRATMSPQAAIDMAAEKINSAVADDLYFYAPLHLAKAKEKHSF